MNTGLEESIKHRVRTSAREKNLPIATLWQLIVMERILSRIGKSKYRNHFILKGGILLSQYLVLGRETRDLDFLLLNLSNDQQTIERIFEEIITINLSDGFSFENPVIRPLIHPASEYQGSRLKLTALFGKSRFKVEIDIGVGDLCQPVETHIDLTRLNIEQIPKAEITLMCYPPEFIFAEKLQSLVLLGDRNSRMKDFYDLFLMLQEPEFLDLKSVWNILSKVFRHRKTSLDLPFFSDSDNIQALQERWELFLKKLNSETIKNREIPLKIQGDFMKKI